MHPLLKNKNNNELKINNNQNRFFINRIDSYLRELDLQKPDFIAHRIPTEPFWLDRQQIITIEKPNVKLKEIELLYPSQQYIFTYVTKEKENIGAAAIIDNKKQSCSSSPTTTNTVHVSLY